MNFNIVNENYEFKMGNIITTFKIENISYEFVLYSADSYDKDESSIFIGLILKDADGYDYISNIDNPNMYKKAVLVARDILKKVVS